MAPLNTCQANPMPNVELRPREESGGALETAMAVASIAFSLASMLSAAKLLGVSDLSWTWTLAPVWVLLSGAVGIAVPATAYFLITRKTEKHDEESD